MAGRLSARIAHRRHGGLSPGARLFALFSVVTLLGLAALAVVLARGVRNDIRDGASLHATQLANALSRAAFGPLLVEENVPAHERAMQFERATRAAKASAPVLGVAVFDATGRVVYSSHPSDVGRRPPPPPALRTALAGRTATVVVGANVESLDRSARKRIDAHVPIASNGVVIGAAEMELDYAPVAAEIRDRVRNVWMIIAGAALLIYVALLPAVLRLARTLGSDNDPAERALLADLRSSLGGGGAQIELVYQPIVDMTSGRVSAVEALARWTHPTRGAVPPDTFVPVLERSDLLWPFTLHVIEAAVRQCAEWRRHGLHLSVAVNLSAAAAIDERLPDEIQRILERHRLPGRFLEIEVTEAAIMTRPERAMSVLGALRTHGVGVIAIDDFGTGYSSLARLRVLPVQALKIDRSFLLEMVERGDAALVASIVALAHNLELLVIAEGIEDETAWVELAALNCDRAQGYFIARPQPAAAIAPWLERHDAARLAALSAGQTARDRRTGMRRRREDVFVPAVERAADAVVVLDDDGRYVYANPCAAEIYGVERGELEGQWLGRFAAPGRSDQVEADFRTLRREGRVRMRHEIVTGDGRRRVVDFNIRADVLPGRHLAIGREVEA